MEQKDPDSQREEPSFDSGEDDSNSEERVAQRAIANLRERLRLQDDEIDHLRAMIRAVYNQAPSDQGERFASRIDLVDRLAERVAALESDLGEQGKTVLLLRDVMGRTDANLQRLITEVDRLVTEIARRPEQRAAAHTMASAPRGESAASAPDVDDAGFAALPNAIPPVEREDIIEDDGSPVEPVRFRWKVPALVLLILVALLWAGWFLFGSGRSSSAHLFRSAPGSSVSPIEQARLYENEKNYAKAEVIYRDLLKKEPNNGEVIRHLASVLFRQDKWDQSAAVLKRLSGGSGELSSP